MDNKNRGFTIIELLIIIIIISLVASVVLVAVNKARIKARDTKRVSEISQLVRLLATEAGSTNETLTGCTAANVGVSTCTGPRTLSQFANFKDPSSSTACTPSSTGVCDYSISRANGTAGAGTLDYRICFYLEGDISGISAGLNQVKSTSVGSISSGCN